MECLCIHTFKMENRKRREKKKEKTNARTHANREKNANNGARLVGGSVYVKTMCGQRRRGKKEGHKTDQECAVHSHTIIIAINHTRAFFERRTFFLSYSRFFSLLYSYTRTNIKVHLSSIFVSFFRTLNCFNINNNILSCR